MNWFYCVLAFAMAVFNLYRGTHSLDIMHYVMAALWLIIAVVFTAKHILKMKKAKRQKQLPKRED